MNTLQVSGGANGKPLQITFEPTMLAGKDKKAKTPRGNKKKPTKKKSKRSDEQRMKDYKEVRLKYVKENMVNLYQYFFEKDNNAMEYWNDRIVIWEKRGEYIHYVTDPEEKRDAVEFWFKVASVSRFKTGIKYFANAKENKDEPVNFEIIRPGTDTNFTWYRIYPRKAKADLPEEPAQPAMQAGRQMHADAAAPRISWLRR